MSSLGSNIAKYRIRLGLTQRELAAKLKVFTHEVSKWEKGEMQPDSNTVKRLCEIFNVTMTELVGFEDNSNIVQADSREYTEAMERRRANAEYADFQRQTNKSIIFGALAGVGAGALFAVLFIVVVTLEPVWVTAILSVVVGLGYFAFVMQVFWDGVVIEVFMFFLRSFRLPGVIFTLDLDGLIFLIAFKILGAIVVGILSVLWFILGLFITPLVALVVLPFAAVKRGTEGRNLKILAQ